MVGAFVFALQPLVPSLCLTFGEVLLYFVAAVNTVVFVSLEVLESSFERTRASLLYVEKSNLNK